MTVEVVMEPWVPDTSTFGARLALVRQRMRWNVKEAALACGLPAGSWREWELAGRLPRHLDEVCTRIAAATGCNDIWLMSGRTTPTPPAGGGPQSLLSGSNRRALAYLVAAGAADTYYDAPAEELDYAA